MSKLNINIPSEGQDMFGGSTGAMFEHNSLGSYRYCLWRIWDSSLPLIMFIGVNPSKANGVDNDATIRRVKGFAGDWGYGGFYMLNLFGIVSTDPRILKTHPNPVGDNDVWLERIAPRCEKIIFAWGNFKEAKERAEAVIKMFPDAYALGFNKNGTPWHPLMVPKITKPIKFNQ